MHRLLPFHRLSSIQPSRQGNKHRHIRLPALLLMLLALTTTGCAGTNTRIAESSGAAAATSATAVSEAGSQLQILTTLFPQYDFARIVAGDRAQVRLLLPPGMEAHAYEPSPKDIVAIGKADLFLYTGDVMEPWVARVLESLSSASVRIVDTSAGIVLATAEEEDADHTAETGAHAGETAADADADDVDAGESDAHADEPDTHADESDAHDDEPDADADAHEHGVDPHIWLDPTLAVRMVRNITDALVQADPEGAADYRSRAEAYIRELEAYDDACKTAFTKTDSRTLVFAGHFAFGYFARRYGLDHVSPYQGFSPDAEPTPRRIAEMIDQMKTLGTSTLYYEELVDPKVAEVLSAATGADMVLLHGAHNISPAEMEAEVSYLGIMQENLEKLKKGLGYHE